MGTQAISGIDIVAAFESQKRNALQLKKSTSQDRISRLLKFRDVINKNTDNIKKALYNDFRKPVEEAIIEIGPITDEIEFVTTHLETWMRPQVVPTPESLKGEAVVSKIILEPKGVCLFLTPWNYPFTLTFRPLIACLAAGNTAIIKPSELTPHSSKLIKEIIDSVFSEDEVFVVEGGAEVASELLKLPFNHIHYTGGKYYMSNESWKVSDISRMLNNEPVQEKPKFVYSGKNARRDLAITFKPASTSFNDYSATS